MQQSLVYYVSYQVTVCLRYLRILSVSRLHAGLRRSQAFGLENDRERDRDKQVRSSRNEVLSGAVSWKNLKSKACLQLLNFDSKKSNS